MSSTEDSSNPYYGKDGHPFFGQKHTDEWKLNQSKRTSNCRWVNDGSIESFTDEYEHLLKCGWKLGRIIIEENRKKLALSGSRNLLKAREAYKNKIHLLISSGKHPSQQKWTCPHCAKSGKGKGNYTKFHGAKCLMNKEYIQP
jgi:hypothetical protein